MNTYGNGTDGAWGFVLADGNLVDMVEMTSLKEKCTGGSVHSVVNQWAVLNSLWWKAKVGMNVNEEELLEDVRKMRRMTFRR